MNVVILDNDAALAKSLEILIAGMGHEARAFIDPLAACAHIEDGAPVDVLVLDYLMPGLDGRQVLGRFGALEAGQAGGRPGRRFEVILISGHAELFGPAELESMGVSAFLPKPLDLDRLCDLVESCRERREARKR